MSTVRVDRVEDRAWNPLWDSTDGVLGNVTTSTGTQPVAEALDRRAVSADSIAEAESLTGISPDQDITIKGSSYTWGGDNVLANGIYGIKSFGVKGDGTAV